MSAATATAIVAPAGAITPPLKGSAYRRAAAASWAPGGAGYSVRPLFEDAATGERTLLMRIEPGTVSHPHAHDGEFEQIFLLEGSFEDDNGMLKPGDYACRAPGAIHSGRTATGCVMLLIYSRRPAWIDNPAGASRVKVRRRARPCRTAGHPADGAARRPPRRAESAGR